MPRLVSIALTILVFSPAILALVEFGRVRVPKRRRIHRHTTAPLQLWEVPPQPIGVEDSTYHAINRRNILAAALLSSVIVVGAPAARAVKPRNEALCDTGLFDNFLEYRCTPLGNIEDEGAGRKMSETEESTTSSLMSKLMMDQNIDSSSLDEKTNNDSSRSVDTTSEEGSEFTKR